MKLRFASSISALALFGAVSLNALSQPAEAQTVSGGYYYVPAPTYVVPQPTYVYPPAYAYPAPTYYYYQPAPTYYYPPPVYAPQPSYWVPGVTASFVFRFGGGHSHHWRHH